MKGIAVYGMYITYDPVRQRYWKWAYHRTGPKAGEKWYKRRVWKTTKRLKKVERKGRYEFEGPGRDLYRSVMEAIRAPPREYVEVSTEDFLEHPERYSSDGYWIRRPIVES
ncbi:hypothetical protein ACFL0D_04915 [Thermoproteota archaeon]